MFMTEPTTNHSIENRSNAKKSSRELDIFSKPLEPLVYVIIRLPLNPIETVPLCWLAAGCGRGKVI